MFKNLLAMHQAVRPVEVKIMENNCGRQTEYHVGNPVVLNVVVELGNSGLVHFNNANPIQRKDEHRAHGVTELHPKLLRLWKYFLNETMSQSVFENHPKNQERQARWNEIAKQVHQKHSEPDFRKGCRVH